MTIKVYHIQVVRDLDISLSVHRGHTCSIEAMPVRVHMFTHAHRYSLTATSQGGGPYVHGLMSALVILCSHHLMQPNPDVQVIMSTDTTIIITHICIMF